LNLIIYDESTIDDTHAIRDDPRDVIREPATRVMLLMMLRAKVHVLLPVDDRFRAMMSLLFIMMIQRDERHADDYLFPRRHDTGLRCHV